MEVFILICLISTTYSQWPFTQEPSPIIRTQKNQEIIPTAELFFVPVIIQNSFTNDWPATNWTAKYLSQYAPVLNIKAQRASTFFYDGGLKPFSWIGIDKPFGRAGAELNDVHLPDTIPIDQVFEMMKTKENDCFVDHCRLDEPIYYYFSADASHLHSSLKKDLEPHNNWLKNGGLMFKNTENSNFWMAKAGSTAQCHFDSSDNYYVQLRGSKRFIMFPPEAHNDLYLYSSLHTLARRSQYNFEEKELDSELRFLHISNLTAQVAILNPGDILHVPPFWFHHVTALSDDPASFSYNVWSDLLLIDNISERTNLEMCPFTPFETHISKQHPILSELPQFLDGLIANVLVSTTQEKKDLLLRRYIRILDQYPSLENVLKIVCQGKKRTPLSEKQIQYLDYVSSPFIQIKDPAIREILLFDFIEQISGYLIGIQYVISFLTYCW